MKPNPLLTLVVVVALCVAGFSARASDGSPMSGVEQGLAQIHGNDIRFCAFKPNQEPHHDDNTVSYDIRCVDIPRAVARKTFQDCTFVLVDVGVRVDAAIYCGTEGTL